eukprot:6886260-Alexandrium_andersonii.AAC.1
MQKDPLRRSESADVGAQRLERRAPRAPRFAQAPRARGPELEAGLIHIFPGPGIPQSSEFESQREF